MDILKTLPPSVTPKSLLIKHTATAAEVMEILSTNGFEFPFIFKPDLGERGFMVKKIVDEAAIDNYLREIQVDFIVQDLVDLPYEFGVYYRRFPNALNGVVTSIVMKEMLAITGDGIHTFSELVEHVDRARLQQKVLAARFEKQWHTIPAKGERIELVSIGNHCLGTKFIDVCHLITDQLSNSFDRISKHVDGFYFGRYDLRCASIEALENGDIKIMELNGCGAEPGHIYSPGFPLWKALLILYRHLRDMYVVSYQNKQRGLEYMPLKEAVRLYKRFREATL